MRAYLTIGIPASGKTVWAQEAVMDRLPSHDLVRVERDVVRKRLKVGNGEAEELVTQRCRRDIECAAFALWDAILSDTNLNTKFRKELVLFLKDLEFTVEAVVFDTPFWVCFWRNLWRPNRVPFSVMWRMQKRRKKLTDRALIDEGFEAVSHILT